MKIVAILLFAFLNSSAVAAPNYISVEADHANHLYSEGETANFFIHQDVNPTNPDYRILVTGTFTGVQGEFEIPLQNGVAIYVSPKLVVGSAALALNVRLIRANLINPSISEVLISAPVVQQLNLDISVEAILFNSLKKMVKTENLSNVSTPKKAIGTTAKLSYMDMGNVVVGQSKTILSGSCNNGIETQTYVSIGISGGEFTFTDINCVGAILAPGQCCEAQITFSPTTAGYQSTNLVGVAVPNGTFSGGWSGTGINSNALPKYPESLSDLSPSLNVSSDGSTISEMGAAITINKNPVSTCAPYCTVFPNPVNIGTGSMWHEFNDFIVPGRTRATDINFKRYYLGQSAAPAGDFGPRWFHSFETRIIALNYSPTTNLIWIDQMGGAWTFTRNQDNSFASPSGFSGTLVEEENSYVITKKHGIQLEFTRLSNIAPVGSLISIKDPHGEQLQLTYAPNGKLQTISSPFAGSVNFVRDSTGKVTQITRVRDNLSYSYTYQANGNLESSSDFAGNTTQYAYVSSPTAATGRLSSIIDPIGRATQFNYAFITVTSQFEPGNASRAFTYHGFTNRSTKVYDVDDSVSTYHFDSQYRTIQIDQPDGSVVYQTWTPNNQLASITDELGFTTQFTYDLRGNLASIKKPEDATPTTISYDQTFDLPMLVTPLTGNATQFTVDPANGNVTHIQRGALSLDFTFDNFGNLISTNNGRTTYADERNSNGLLTLSFDAHNPETRTYDSRGRVHTRTFQSGRVLTYAFDDFDRVTQITDSHGPTSVNTYDVVGRLITTSKVSGAKMQTTTLEWDARDRLVSTTNALGEKTTYSYHPTIITDKPIAITDPKGHTTQFEYDIRQRLKKQIDAKGAITHFGYNLRGDLTHVTDPNSDLTTFEYDGNRRLTVKREASLRTNFDGISFPVVSVTRYSYDADGKLIRKKVESANGGNDLVTEYTFDGFDRLIRSVQKTELNGNTVTVEDDSSFTYENQLDAVLLKTANNGVANLNFNVEAASPFKITGYGIHATDSNNPLSLIQDDYTITRDVTGEIKSIVNSAGVKLIGSKHDPAGRLTQITGKLSATSPVLKTAIQYDGFGRRSKLAHSTGMTELVTYDDLNRVKTMDWKDAFAPFMNQRLQYDQAGNITQKIRNDGQFTMDYDSINQLIESRTIKKLGYFENYNQDFSYDLAGNRTSDAKRGTAQFIANGIISDGKANYKADSDGFGNLTEEKDPKTGMSKFYSYRVDGKLKSFDSLLGPQYLHVDYFHDALGRRVAKRINQNQNVYTQTFTHLENMDKILLGKSGDGKVTLYMDGQGIDEHLGEVNAARALGYVSDELGSVLNSGVAGESRSYGLNGEVFSKYLQLSQNSNPVNYGWQGLEFDLENRLYDNSARAYSANLARFTSRDPIGFMSGEINLYRSRKNNAGRFIDPDGFKNINLTGKPLPNNYFVNELNASSVDVIYYDDSTLDSMTLGTTLKDRDYSKYKPGNPINIAISPNQTEAERNVTVTHEAVHAYGIATTGGLQSGLSGYDHAVLTPENDLLQFIAESNRVSCGP